MRTRHFLRSDYERLVILLIHTVPNVPGNRLSVKLYQTIVSSAEEIRLNHTEITGYFGRII